MARGKPKTVAGGMMVRPFKILVTLMLYTSFNGVLFASIPEFTEEGFRIPQPYQKLEFPRTHGSHPEFKIEWWYLTGHLFSESGRPFGYQATFFRFAGSAENRRDENKSFGLSQLHSTQVALTDIENQKFYFDERLDRQGWDAFASEEELDLKHGPWMLKMVDSDSESMELQFNIRDKVSLDLQLQPTKPKVIFGADGTSRKGPDPAARSYYITFTRLSVSGLLNLEGKTIKVTGEAWMDHEISSQQLSENLEGWDWTAIQLEDGREVKAYLLRQKDGTPSEFSQLIWIDKTGQTTYQSFDESGFTWTKDAFWTSPTTGTAYPNTVTIKTKDPQTGSVRQFSLFPEVMNQEITGDLNGTHYWEGACQVRDANDQLIGRAYLELAGYDRSLSRALR
jgi:predicted secreted hydrolase